MNYNQVNQILRELQITFREDLIENINVEEIYKVIEDDINWISNEDSYEEFYLIEKGDNIETITTKINNHLSGIGKTCNYDKLSTIIIESIMKNRKEYKKREKIEQELNKKLFEIYFNFYKEKNLISVGNNKKRKLDQSDIMDE